ncbi:chorismate mutase [Streptomyces rubrolavendulae]|uniref:Intracellular chorismate mutase n=1 Tax=Streptomyces rubrolavendulae TaxID=285473 RepID=A0A1D8G561_9ACTN|nr:chorismate mutase [Streptomyces rubrolavendulae]AOT60585.1 Intracellular chorismate mutase [Streptomyces rubrolavendulae]
MTPTTTPARTAPAAPAAARATTASAASRPGAPAAPHPQAAAGTTPRAASKADPRTAAEITGARSDDAAELIAGARERIDALDDRIIGLIQERMAVSAVIQEARIGSGGRRVNLAREMEILGRYRDALGKPGTALSMNVLELCRGRV